MADFYPTTVIRILKNVPLDNTYSDVIKFSSLTEQQNYFISKTKNIFSNLSIQRVNYSVAPQDRPPLSCTVPINAETIYDCNYIMFQNSNYGNKWFYAFITNIGYVSPNVSKIFYSIDDFQTWQFDFEIGPSYVEREHTNDDTIGSNLVNEPITVSEYVVNGTRSSGSVTPYMTIDSYSNDKYFILYTTQPIDSAVTIAREIYDSNFVSGVWTYIFNSSQALVTKLNAITDHSIVIAAQACPINTNLSDPIPITNAIAPARPSNILGYTDIQNNKLLTYPYIKLVQETSDGATNEFKYEFFLNPQNIIFNNITSVSPQPSVEIYPLNYENVSANFRYTTTLNNFPIVPLTGDVFKSWYAQNQASIETKLNNASNAQWVSNLTGFLTFLGGAAVAGAAPVGKTAGVATMLAGLGQITSGFVSNQNTINSVSAEISDMQSKPAVLKNKGLGNNTYFTGNYGTYYYSMCITENEAKRIDSFFTRYGYQTNEVKVPNLTGRENFNYVKLKNPYITGSVPVESMANIKTMFTNGIRLWHSAENYMNFNVSNKIVEVA